MNPASPNNQKKSFTTQTSSLEANWGSSIELSNTDQQNSSVSSDSDSRSLDNRNTGPSNRSLPDSNLLRSGHLLLGEGLRAERSNSGSKEEGKE